MRLYVWIPGILGSGLKQKNAPNGVIWPPGQVDAFCSRTYAQLTDDLEPDGIVEKVCVVAVYSPMTDLFRQANIPAYVAGTGQAEAVMPFAYDWRRSLRDVASELADQLDAQTKDGDEIVIVAHSMGALTSRYLIEADVFAGRPFSGRISKFVSINGPLLGAPVMLARAMGLDQTEFVVWADQPKLLACAPFAGAYCLLPSPATGRLSNGGAPIDVWNPYYYQALQFGVENMQEAQQFWTALDGKGCRVQYVLITSVLSDPATIENVDYANGAWAYHMGDGDSAVPPWSSKPDLPGAIVPDTLPGDHLGVIATPGFRLLFNQYVAPLPPAPAPVLLIQALRSHLLASGVAEFSVVETGAGDDQATLTWTLLDDQGDTIGQPLPSQTVGLPNQPAPILRVKAPNAPGNYGVDLALNGQTAHTRVVVRPATEQPQVLQTAPPQAPQ